MTKEEKIDLISTGLMGWKPVYGKVRLHRLSKNMPYLSHWVDRDARQVADGKWNPYDSWHDCGMVWDELTTWKNEEDEIRWYRFLRKLEREIGLSPRLEKLNKTAICDAVVAMLEGGKK